MASYLKKKRRIKVNAKQKVLFLLFPVFLEYLTYVHDIIQQAAGVVVIENHS